MERPMPLPRGMRPRARHRYDGFVDKREPRDRGYRKVWAGLRGLTLAFYRGPQDLEHRRSSLAGVVQLFVERGEGSLRPLHPEDSPRLGQKQLSVRGALTPAA